LDTPGDKGAFLRKERLYSQQICKWRKEAEEGKLNGLSQKKRGRKKKLSDEQIKIQKLEKEKAALEKKLKKAEMIIEFQKKIADLMGDPIVNQEDEQ